MREAPIELDNDIVIATEPMLDALCEYLGAVRAKLGLAEWHLIVSRRLPKALDGGEPPFAQVIPTDGRYIAVIKFDEAFWRAPAAEQRNAVVHELAHLLHVGVTEPIRTGHYRTLVGGAAADGLWEQVRMAAEYMTDKLTSLLQELVPLPELPRPAGPAGAIVGGHEATDGAVAVSVGGGGDLGGG